MSLKNKIKIDSFAVGRMTLTDIPEVLKLAIDAQCSFGLTDKKAPSLFLSEISGILLKNTLYSFVFRHEERVFAAFIIQPQTNISAEFILAVSDKNVIQTQEMYDKFIEYVDKLPFDELFAKIYKKRKKFSAYIRFLNTFGFTNQILENDSELVLSRKKM